MVGDTANSLHSTHLAGLVAGFACCSQQGSYRNKGRTAGRSPRNDPVKGEARGTIPTPCILGYFTRVRFGPLTGPSIE